MADIDKERTLPTSRRSHGRQSQFNHYPPRNNPLRPVTVMVTSEGSIGRSRTVW